MSGQKNPLASKGARQAVIEGREENEDCHIERRESELGEPLYEIRVTRTGTFWSTVSVSPAIAAKMSDTLLSMLAEDGQDDARREQQKDERVRELEKKLHATRVALSNLLSVAEAVDKSNIKNHGVHTLWDGNIDQADRVLGGERPTGEGEFGALTEEELAVVDNAGDTDA